MLARDKEWQATGMVVGTVFHLAFLVADRWLAGPLIPYYTALHLAFLGVATAWYLARKKHEALGLALVVTAHYLTVLAYFYALSFDLVAATRAPASSPLWENVLLTWTGSASFGVVSLLLLPNRKRLLTASVALYGAATLLAWLSWDGGWRVAAVFFLGFPVVLVFKRQIFLAHVNEAMLEYRAEQATALADSAWYVRELELAAELRRALAPKAALCATGTKVRMHVGTEENPRSSWVASTATADKRLRSIAVLPSGAGIEAAMAGHAVYALWTSAALDPGFDAETWLKDATQCLDVLRIAARICVAEVGHDGILVLGALDLAWIARRGSPQGFERADALKGPAAPAKLWLDDASELILVPCEQKAGTGPCEVPGPLVEGWDEGTIPRDLAIAWLSFSDRRGQAA